jgi:RimJ/RimL family protein N-acetyltransferase
MRLEPVLDTARRDALLAGDLGGLTAARGWPHDDTAPGMSFLDTGGRVFLVIDDDGRVAGECGTKTPVRANGSVEIGYGLAAPSRGHGLGTAAVGALVDLLSAQPDIRFIDAEVHVDNEPSWRILRGLGFTETGTVVNGFQRLVLDVRRMP